MPLGAARPRFPAVARALAVDAACVVALLVACAWQLADLERVVDLAPWDEATYLRTGTSLSWRGLPDAEWGPLYAIWYFALSRLEPDRIALFYLAYRALFVLPALGIYAASRRLGGGPAISLVGSLLYVVSLAPHILPRPTLLALLLLLAGVAAVATARRFSTFAAAAGLAFLAAAYARPELFVSFAGATAVLAGALFAELRAGRSTVRRAALVGAVYATFVAAAVAGLGNPFGNGSNRRMYAFCQHYAVGAVLRGEADVDPWGECRKVVSAAFGDATSVGEAARRNPRAFFTHVAANASAYPEESLALFVRGFGRARIDEGPWTAPRAAHVAGLAGVAMWILWAAWGGRRRLARALAAPATVGAALVFLAVLGPSALSSVLIQPREHYLVLQGVFGAIFAVTWLAQAKRTAEAERALARPARVWSVPRLAGALGLAIVTVAASPRFVHRPESAPVLANGEAVRLLDARPQMAPVRPGLALGILELEGGLDAYAATGLRRVSPTDRRPGETLRAFFERRSVVVVVLSPNLARFRGLAEDPEFRAFVAAPEAFGFEATPVGETGLSVAVARAGAAAAAQQAWLGRPLPVSRVR